MPAKDPKAYEASEKCKATRARYRASKARAAALAKYAESPKYKANYTRGVVKRRDHLLRYKPTPEELHRLQNQTICMICGRDDLFLVVDHNHDTGQIRDRLCRSCNIRVGFVEGPHLQRTVEYVTHWNSTKNLP